MSTRDDQIRRVVAELDAHIAEVEASVAVLKALLAGDEVPGEEENPVNPEASLADSVRTSGWMPVPSLPYSGQRGDPVVVRPSVAQLVRVEIEPGPAPGRHHFLVQRLG
jgi:hypothetical protein